MCRILREMLRLVVYRGSKVVFGRRLMRRLRRMLLMSLEMMHLMCSYNLHQYIVPAKKRYNLRITTIPPL